jgi:hypothetical protein
MIDGRHQCVGRGGEESINLELNLRAAFSHRPLVAPPDAREGKQRAFFAPAQAKSMPASWLHVAVGLAE